MSCTDTDVHGIACMSRNGAATQYSNCLAAEVALLVSFVEVC